MYTVIYSKSPYLLARMATDLQMGGYENTDLDWHPFTVVDKWLQIDNKYFCCLGHSGVGSPIRHTLTSRNYLKVLGAILNRLPALESDYITFINREK